MSSSGRGGSGWILGKTSSLKRWWDIGSGCPGQRWSHHPRKCSKNMWMLHLGTWISGGHGSAGVTFGLDGLSGLFLSAQFCDSMIPVLLPCAACAHSAVVGMWLLAQEVFAGFWSELHTEKLPVWLLQLCPSLVAQEVFKPLMKHLRASCQSFCRAGKGFLKTYGILIWKKFRSRNLFLSCHLAAQFLFPHVWRVLSKIMSLYKIKFFTNKIWSLRKWKKSNKLWVSELWPFLN